MNPSAPLVGDDESHTNEGAIGSMRELRLLPFVHPFGLLLRQACDGEGRLPDARASFSGACDQICSRAFREAIGGWVDAAAGNGRFEFPSGGGEMSVLIKAYDWAAGPGQLMDN